MPRRKQEPEPPGVLDGLKLLFGLIGRGLRAMGRRFLNWMDKKLQRRKIRGMLENLPKGYGKTNGFTIEDRDLAWFMSEVLYMQVKPKEISLKRVKCKGLPDSWNVIIKEGK